MKLEHQETPAAKPQEPAQQRSKPVVVYIMILFIAAFLLMALSFLMHQRSNSEALGQLETSFNATIEEVQETQIRIAELEKTLAETKAALEASQSETSEAQAQLEKTQAMLETTELALEAQRMLYAIQQTYSAGDYEGCQVLIAEAEATGIIDALPPTPLDTSEGPITAPFVRFQQFKYAVSLKLAELEAVE